MPFAARCLRSAPPLFARRRIAAYRNRKTGPCRSPTVGCRNKLTHAINEIQHPFYEEYIHPPTIELLAPAKNAECGIEAIRHGADAVYIGGPGFGARAAAGNSIEDIARLCDFAHTFGARIYVTFNTILWNDELATAERMVWDLYRADRCIDCARLEFAANEATPHRPARFDTDG